MTVPAETRICVGILIFDQVDLLDVGGPFEVLLTANRLMRRSGRPEAFDVVTVSPDAAEVTTYGGIVMRPHLAIADLGAIDVLVVPGAVEIEAVLADEEIAAAVAELAARAQLTTSVCTGAFLLADAGRLDGRRWTTHWEDVPALAERMAARVTRSGDARAQGAGGAAGGRPRIVESGDVITAGGLTCGIDLGLRLVERLVDADLAALTARQLDHPWDPTT